MYAGVPRICPSTVMRDLGDFALGEAEVHEVRLAVVVEHDVRRLQVAVDDALLVRVMQGPRHFRHNSAASRKPMLLAVSQSARSTPANQIADDEDDVFVPADFVNRHDVRMPKLRRRPRLAKELLDLGGRQLTFAWNLDRDHAVELRVAGLPHRSEPADADAGIRVRIGRSS